MGDKVAGSCTVSRRGFLKTTAALSVAGALGAGALLEGCGEAEAATGEERIVFNQCRTGCVTGCPLQVKVRDGHVVQTLPADTPDGVYKHACLRGLSHVQAMYSPNRVQYPMKRTARGSDEWERISWDQAVEEIGSKLLSVREQYGSQANAIMSNGGNTSLLCGPYGGLGRFKNAFEMQPIDNCVDFGCMPALNRVYGPTGGYGACAEPADLENADTFFVWGCNLTTTFWDRWQHMMRAIDNGAKLVVIDPFFTPIASKANKYVSIRPASDGALIMAMINEGISRELLDYDFIKRATVGPFLVRRDTGKFLRKSDLGIAPVEGPVDSKTGQPTIIDDAVVFDEQTLDFAGHNEATAPALNGTWTVEGIEVDTAFDLLMRRASEFTVAFAAEQCDVSEQEVNDLIDLYYHGGTVANMLGFGTNGFDNSPYMGHAFATLVVLSGQIGKPGTNAAYNNINGFSADPMFMFPGMRNLTRKSLPLLGLPQMMEAGSVVLPNGEFTAPKTLWITMVNPYNNFLNPQTWRDVVLPKLEMVVVVDRAFTDTARYLADYVLPAAHLFESEDIRPNLVSSPYTVYGDKAVDPLGEARSDFDIYKLFSQKLGFSEFFDMDEKEAIRQAYTGDFDELVSEKIVRYLPEGFQPYSIDAGNITTPSGKFEFYCEAPTNRLGSPLPDELFEDNCLPTFKKPTEAWPDVEGSDLYPFVLTSMRSRGLLHSQFGDVEWLREIHPEPIVFIHPEDAAEKGLVDGDYVKLFNDRGYGVVRLVVSDGQRRGCLSWPKGWEQKFYKDGNLHQLTPIAYNPVTINHSYCDCHVNIEKWEA